MNPPTCCGMPMTWTGQTGASNATGSTLTHHWRCSICTKTKTTSA